MLILQVAIIAGCAIGATAQVSTVSLSPIGFTDDDLQGEIVGSGADGTTYILSGTFNSLTIPFTMTLVEDASHVSMTADIATGSTTVNVGINCDINNGREACTELLSASALSTTTEIIITGTEALTGVVVAPSSSSVLTSEATVTVTQAPVSTSSSSASQATYTLAFLIYSCLICSYLLAYL